MTKALVSSLLLCAALPLYAADVAITVVTPARTARSAADVPGQVEVITGRELEDTPGATLNDKLVNAVPGAVTNRSNGIYSFASVVSLRGLPASDQGRTLVLLDGVPVNTGATGAVNWNRLAAEDIDRIEVFKGPVSSLYGPNGAAGVINIITKKAAGNYKLGTSYGTYNTFGAGAGAGAKIKALTLSADGGYLSSDGYNSTPAARRTAYQYNAPKYALEKHASAKAALDLEEAGSLEAQYSRDEGLFGEGTRIRTAEGAHRGFNTDAARAAWRGDRDGLAWQAQAYYQLEDYTRLNESCGGANCGTYTRVDTFVTRQDSGGQAAVSLPLAGLTATFGADYKDGLADGTDHNWAAGSTPAYDDRDRGRLTQYAPYAQAEKRFFSDRLKLLAGLRYDNAVYSDGYFYNPSNAAYNPVNGPQRDRYWDKFSPKLAASWKYSGTVEQYASWGRGFRPPSLEDMCLTLLKKTVLNIANPDLKPETVDTAETGFRLEPLTGLYLEPAAYYTVGRDFIYKTTLDATHAQMKNVGKVEIYGAELPLKYYSGPFSLSASYALSHGEVTANPGNTALEGKALTYAPKQTASASLGLKTKPADLTVNWIWKASQYTQDDNSEYTREYHVVSASASRAFSRSVTAKLTVENIFDARHQDGYVIASATSKTVPDLAPGRTVTVSVEAKF
jgi:iron complex outermembrane receptor protein